MSGDGNGWTGRDPRLRLLRTIAFLVILVLFAYVVVVKESRDVATIGTLAGMLLIFGGFEAGIRWDSLAARRDPPAIQPNVLSPYAQPETPVPGEEEWDSP